MPQIHILPQDVASKIAAGEVIERPASVVKELIENAIDAGASTIHVEIKQAGRRMIRISDDGCGIAPEQVEVAFARHATSKLLTVEDLDRLQTLGFRGEALASIAAVSRVTMTTCVGDGQIGTRLQLEGAHVVRSEPSAHPRGTTIGVENLFYNVPARLKFLRSDATERKHINTLIVRYAMAYPELHFSLENDERLTFRSPGSGDLRDVLIEVFGLQVAEAMLAVGAPQGEDAESGIHVWGYASQPDTHRGVRDQITLFVNGRWVQERGLSFAVEQAYHTLLPVRRHPIAVLMVTLPPHQVDVNVHPAKSEVHFQHRDAVFRAVQRVVRNALIAQSPIPQVSSSATKSWQNSQGHTAWQERRQTLVSAGATQAAMDLQRPAAAGSKGQWFGQEAEELERPAKLPPLRVIGQLGQTYILTEGPEGLYLVDQHAAHERVMYEKLLAQHEAKDIAVQSLLEALPVELTPGQAAELSMWLGPLHELGFDIEPFGGYTVLIRAVPALLVRTEIREILLSVIDELSLGEKPLAEETHARIAAVACKQGAVKAGQTLSLPEMQALIRQLEETASPRTCPHGRPTMILLSQGWMEHEFGRK